MTNRTAVSRRARKRDWVEEMLRGQQLKKAAFNAAVVLVDTIEAGNDPAERLAALRHAVHAWRGMLPVYADEPLHPTRADQPAIFDEVTA